jgi:hypothetical protein
MAAAAHATYLDLGRYEIQAELAGQTSIRSDHLDAGTRGGCRLHAGRGGITEHVVDGEAPLVETTSAALGGLVAENR